MGSPGAVPFYFFAFFSLLFYPHVCMHCLYHRRHIVFTFLIGIIVGILFFNLPPCRLLLFFLTIMHHQHFLFFCPRRRLTFLSFFSYCAPAFFSSNQPPTDPSFSVSASRLLYSLPSFLPSFLPCDHQHTIIHGWLVQKISCHKNFMRSHH